MVTRAVRMEERGNVSTLAPHSFQLVFENEPIWLLALLSTSTLHIYIEGCTAMSDFSSRLIENKIDLGLYTSIINTLGRRKFVFLSPPSRSSRYLVAV